jgi:hypothetical protein
MRRFIIVAGVGVAVAASSVAPAHAEDTDVTFELTAAGGLSISAPATADLGSAATNAGALSGSLGTVTVTDERGALLATWTAAVSSTDFTTGGGTEAETIAASDVSYWSGLATATSGTVVAVPGQLTALLAQDLGTARTAFSTTAAVGNNSVSWNPTVVVAVPAAAVVGTYSGTITHSVA